MITWLDAVRDKPLQTLVAFAAVAVASVIAGLLLRAVTRRMRTLRAQVLAAAVAALGVGGLAAFALAWLMVLEASDVRTVVGVLLLTAVVAAVVVVLATAPLGRDARRLEHTLRRIEEGERDVQTGVQRSDELGHVARAVDELTHRLHVLEEERRIYEAERATMLSNIGHDLRTPLAALQAAIEALADGVAPDPDRYLRSMRHDVVALASLVDDLFLLSRIESGRLELPRTAVDLTEIAEEAVEALLPAAEARGIVLDLRAPAPVLVRGNPNALARVIRNLVDNAIRHAPTGSVVIVEAGLSGPVVRVVDEGPGFPQDFRQHAFDRFSRADASRTRTTGGAGLGLAIARGLVEAHGGTIWIEDAPGGRVAFAIPA
jgi:signal transduction histidine kinase